MIAMKEQDIRQIEETIGYEFKNKELLIQAFTKDSFCNEHKDAGADNELLEHFGDKIFDYLVILLEIKYRCTLNSKLKSNLNEADFSKLKESIVEGKSEKEYIEHLDLIKFIRIGNSDLNNPTYDESKSKENLFEAIVGAIAIDCEYDIKTLIEVVDKMTNFINSVKFYKKI